MYIIVYKMAPSAAWYNASPTHASLAALALLGIRLLRLHQALVPRLRLREHRDDVSCLRLTATASMRALDAEPVLAKTRLRAVEWLRKYI